MRSITLLAPGKINLTLDVLGLLPGGYHEIETIFQSVDVCDELEIEVAAARDTRVELQCLREGAPCADFPLDETNLIARAARAFSEATGETFQSTVKVNKLLPIGGGMAGGSTDGAAMLFGLNELFGSPLSSDRLSEMAGTLGADLPFCLTGGTMLGRGKGDLLTPLENNCQMFLCIVKPRKLSVSTPWVYSAFDRYQERSDAASLIRRPNVQQAMDALREGDLEKLLAGLGNVFQPLVFEEHPELQAIAKSLYDLGSWYCQMTGSGPTIFSVVANRQMAHSIRRRMLRNDDDGFIYGSTSPTMKGPPWDFYLAETLNHGVCTKSHAQETCR
ncbi:MAG: 4-(cytidine 5'-diphospho)-2-C-methyl-D-erythritol kinase [Candidatus Obscuribacterales bacterium]